MIGRHDVLWLSIGGRRSCRSEVFAQIKKPRTRLVLLGTKGGPRIGLNASNPAVVGKDLMEIALPV